MSEFQGWHEAWKLSLRGKGKGSGTIPGGKSEGEGGTYVEREGEREGERERKKKEKEGKEGGEAKEMERTCFGSQAVTDTGLAQTVVTSLKNDIH